MGGAVQCSADEPGGLLRGARQREILCGSPRVRAGRHGGVSAVHLEPCLPGELSLCLLPREPPSPGAAYGPDDDAGGEPAVPEEPLFASQNGGGDARFPASIVIRSIGCARAWGLTREETE